VPEVKACVRYLRRSPFKVRQVLDLVRGLEIQQAREVLRLTNRRPAEDVLKLLESAVANAEHNLDMREDDLYVARCWADEGITLRRWRPRARGRATRIRKRTSHVTIVVDRLPERETERRRRRGDGEQSRRARVEASRRARRPRRRKEEERAREEEAKAQAVPAEGGSTEAPSAREEEEERGSTDVARAEDEPGRDDDLTSGAEGARESGEERASTEERGAEDSGVAEDDLSQGTESEGTTESRSAVKSAPEDEKEGT
jgi:large subunit ribosomal protein L22